jgi:hypothetical protein
VTGPRCACGCGERTRGGRWLRGHNARGAQLVVPDWLIEDARDEVGGVTGRLGRFLRDDEDMPPTLLIVVPFEGTPIWTSNCRRDSAEWGRFTDWMWSEPEFGEAIYAVFTTRSRSRDEA